jgi:hypothetical protein
MRPQRRSEIARVSSVSWNGPDLRAAILAGVDNLAHLQAGGGRDGDDDLVDRVVRDELGNHLHGAAHAHAMDVGMDLA